MRKFKVVFICLFLSLFSILRAETSLNKHILVGYWHNFKNGAANGLKLSQVDNSWDVINLSFGEPTSSTDGNIVYNPTAVITSYSIHYTKLYELHWPSPPPSESVPRCAPRTPMPGCFAEQPQRAPRRLLPCEHLAL